MSALAIYVKSAPHISEIIGYPMYSFVKFPIRYFSFFVNKFYEYVIEVHFEHLVNIALSVAINFGINWQFSFPECYSTAAFLSTTLYGAQVAAMQMFRPQQPHLDVFSDQDGLSGWLACLATSIWRAILIIYNPTRRIADKIGNIFGSEFASSSKVSRLIKFAILGSTLADFLFLFHDFIALIFRFKSKSAESSAHRKFHAALLLSFIVSLTFCFLSLNYFS